MLRCVIEIVPRARLWEVDAAITRVRCILLVVASPEHEEIVENLVTLAHFVGS